jgi:hypothetical protein
VQRAWRYVAAPAGDAVADRGQARVEELAPGLGVGGEVGEAGGQVPGGERG